MGQINNRLGNTLLESGFWPPCRAATVGANITLSGLQTIDGVTLIAGDRVLVKDQTNAKTNGIYAASTGNWPRTTDALSNTQFFNGMAVIVALGTLNGGLSFLCTCTDDPVVIGTSSLTFASQQSIASALQTATSTTSAALSTGAKTFVTQSGKSFVAKQWVLIYETSNPDNNLLAEITSYSGTSLVTSVVATAGTGGPFTDWSIVLTNTPAAAGRQPPVGSGNTTGPGSATDSNIAAFDGTTGKLLKDSGKAYAPLVSGPSSATKGNLAVFADTTGKVVQDGGRTFFNVRNIAYGATGDGTTDDTTAVQAALTAAAAVSGTLYIPAGTYKLTSALTATGSVTIFGDGLSSTILKWPSAGGGLSITYGGITSSANVRDLTLAVGTTNGGTALTLVYGVAVSNPGVFPSSCIRDIAIRGSDGFAVTNYWTTGISVSNVSNVQFDNVNIAGSASIQGVGITFLGLPASATYAVQFNIVKSALQWLATAIQYNSYVQGLGVAQSNINFCTTGVFIPGSLTGLLDGLTLTGNYFNCATAVNMQTNVDDIAFTGNYFLEQTASTNTLNLALNDNFAISGNMFLCQTSSGTTGILIGTCAGFGMITGNTFVGYNIGINLQAASNNTNIQSNIYFFATSDVVNTGGAGNKVGGGSK